MNFHNLFKNTIFIFVASFFICMTGDLRSSEKDDFKDRVGFNLPPNKQDMIGVKRDVVAKKRIFKQIRAAGRLAFDPELYTAQNEYIEAIKQLSRVKDSPIADVTQSAKQMIQSARLRLKLLGISDKQIESLNQQDRSDSSLLLNKSGEQVWVYADIYELDLPYVQTGAVAEITVSFLGGKKIIGKVIAVDRVLNPNSRTAKARILVQEAKTLLRPESYVEVTILAPLGEHITVPFDAILDTGRQSLVYVINSQGRVEPRKVMIKFRSDDDVAVEGVKVGEEIITSANFLIDSESRLKATSEPQNGEKSKTPSCASGEHWDTQMAMCMKN